MADSSCAKNDEVNMQSIRFFSIRNRKQSGLAIFAVILLGSSTWGARRENILLPGKEGFNPTASLISDRSGNLYGTTDKGGVQHGGTVFKLTPNKDGRWTESVIYNFCSLTNCKDGKNPSAGLIFDHEGNLYGTTGGGGGGAYGPYKGCDNAYLCGTVFELTPNADGSWTESVLYSFCSVTDCLDGDGSGSGLVFDKVGNLYGTTVAGGDATGCSLGCGTVFELTPKAGGGGWTERVLYSFCSLTNCFDGNSPYASLTSDNAGNLYGTTVAGGDATSCSLGCGTVFELTPKAGGGWTETVLHKFINNGKDGYSPYAGVVFDTAGNLYGTTYIGGAYSDGTVFELMTKNGSWTEKVLHNFNVKGGVAPTTNLIFDSVGNLYGTADGSNGKVWELTPIAGGGWSEKVLHSFIGVDGSGPDASLIFDTIGNLYGTTLEGGTYNHGTVFELTPRVGGGWREKVLHNFGEY
jgi:uncharacterized repeat protein (TIGR03803 family)